MVLPPHLTVSPLCPPRRVEQLSPLLYSGALNIVDKDSTAAVLVEVCYYLDGPGPDADDYSLPYKCEAGQGY